LIISETLIKKGAGPIFSNLARAVDKREKASYWIYDTDSRAEKNIYDVDFTWQVALVIGG